MRLRPRWRDQPVVGVPDRDFEPADASVAAAFEAALETLAKAGARIVPVRLPDGFEALVAAGIVVMYAEMAAFHRDRLAERRQEFPPRLLVLVEEGGSRFPLPTTSMRSAFAA